MDRLTKENVKLKPWYGQKFSVCDISETMWNLILNGLTLNSINKYSLKAIIRELYFKLQRYENIGSSDEIADNMEMFKAYRHVCGGMSPEDIKELVQAKADGLLVKLLCALGSDLWWINDDQHLPRPVV